MRDSEKDGRYRPRCPKCGWHNTRVSAPHSMLDHLLATFSLAAYRCRSCGGRFYRPRRDPRPVEPEEAEE